MSKSLRLGRYHPDHARRGPGGRFHCKRCGIEVPKGRQAWCGNECVEAWRRDHDPGYQRVFLRKRDHGRCCRCGLDTRLVLRIMVRLGFVRRRYSNIAPEPVSWFLCAIGYPAGAAYRTLWDADHVVPLIEGGAPGVDNMRTLCRPCHRVETAALAARRAAARRIKSPPGECASSP